LPLNKNGKNTAQMLNGFKTKSRSSKTGFYVNMGSF